MNREVFYKAEQIVTKRNSLNKLLSAISEMVNLAKSSPNRCRRIRINYAWDYLQECMYDLDSECDFRIVEKTMQSIKEEIEKLDEDLAAL